MATTPTAPAAAAPAGLADNVASALCYALGLITGILFLVLEPYNRNKTIRFHAFQSIFYSVASILLWFVFMFLGVMTVGSTFFLWPIFWLIRLALFVLWLVLIIKAYQGQKLVLPVIGPMAEQQA
ncbi:MAG TPA: hypothetical protein VLX58_21990 [Bryobacteraceae bacterium]|nr:hypothetical protein [Bryobacteraceae bacterium]